MRECPSLFRGQALVSHMYHRYSYLVGPDVHVWTDDRSCSVINSFAHHVFPEQSVLLLQDLVRGKEKTLT